jgi:predicted dehydrogenase
MKTIGIGMVGTGFMARVHSLAYTALPFYKWPLVVSPRMAVIADIDSELAAEGARRYGYARSTNDWRQVIEDPDVDVVDILTPNNLHAEMAIAAARRGKHVICEKPLACNAREAQEMYDAVTRAGVHHMVGYNYRRTPAVAEAKKLIGRGDLGRVFHFRGTYLQDFGIDPRLPLWWRFQKSQAGSGSLGDIGSHVLDLALHLVGDVEFVTAISRTFIPERPLMTAKPNFLSTAGAGFAVTEPDEMGRVDVDDVTAILLEFAGGATGTLEATRFAAGRKNHLGFEINGEKGSLAFDWEHPAELRYYNATDPSDTQGFKTILTGPQHPNGELLWPLAGFGLGFPEPIIVMMNEFLEELGGGPRQSTGFEAGVKNSRVMDAVVCSVTSGKKERVS